MSALLLTTLRLAVSALAIAALWRSARRALAGGDDPLDADDARLGAAVLVATAVSLTALALGTFGLLAWPAWIGLLAGVAAFTAWLHRGRPRPEPSEFPLSPVFAFALTGFLVGSVIYSLRNPLADRDSLQYHLPMIAHWLSTHALGAPRLVPLEAYAAYPGGSELLGLFLASAAGRDALTVWPSLLALVFVALAVRRTAIELGAGRAAAESVALLLVTAPGVVVIGRTLQTDALLAAWCAIGLRFGLRFRAFEEPRDLAIAIVALGLMSGCRATGGVLAAAALGAILLLPPRPSAARAIEAGGWPWLTALVLGGFWIARDLAATGNPVYPGTVAVMGHTFAGPIGVDLVRGTSQLAVWREHFAGHLTIGNLLRFYSAALVLSPLGAAAVFVPRVRREALPLLAFALLGFALFLVSPFSGANLPSVGGAPPALAPGNLRFLLTSVVALAPAAAAVLSAAALPGWLAPALASLAALFQVRATLVRYAIGVVLAAPFVALGRSRARAAFDRPAIAVAAVLIIAAAIALAVKVTAAARDRVTVQAWQKFEREGIPPFDPALLAKVRAAARGGTIAEVGMRASYMLTGADFSVRVEYVPVAADGHEEQGSFAWGADDRAHPDHAAWLRRIDALHPKLLLLVEDEASVGAPERAWLADTSRFRIFATSGADTAWAPRSSATPR